MKQDRSLPDAQNKATPAGVRDMVLRRFRVTNFRSVIDSGWLDIGEVTALVGVNESGKTNLLLPLWKLNPARGGEIEPTSDYPKALFTTIRAVPGDFRFVEAEFDAGPRAAEFAKASGLSEREAGLVRVARYFDGHFTVSFPRHRPDRMVAAEWVHDRLDEARARMAGGPASGPEHDFRARTLAELERLRDGVDAGEQLGPNTLIRLRDAVAMLLPGDAGEAGEAVAVLQDLRQAVGQRMADLCAADPGSRDEVRGLVLKALPPFVYYSNYGNLDSEIYLPHVVENLSREDLGAKEAAKARTLRVLFGFVGLKPHEVLELGRDFRDIRDEAEKEAIARDGRVGRLRSFFSRMSTAEVRPEAGELARIAEAKRTRSILMQSAGTKLTARFADWWKQGDYRFRFEADGNHFRIWVADARRPQEIELENRSTGLQWFLSFFLVFMVESMGAYRRAVLLLDEPGQSLHPLAQRDLSAFFDNLAGTNQLIYTCHSPFLVDADRLDRARKVYVGEDGSTRATSDLRETEGTDSQRGAVYAVRAALTLSVAEAMLLGTRPVLVAGQTEQIHLGTIRSLLTAAGRFAPRRDLVFTPAGASRIARVAASLMSGEDGALPPVLMGSGEGQAALAEDLRKGLYAEAPGRVLSMAALAGLTEAEVEDLFPAAFLADQLDRIERRPEVRLADIVVPGKPFLPQVEAWAATQRLALPADWRLLLARRVRTEALTRGPAGFAPEALDRWASLFDRLTRADTEDALRAA
jgi:energy-coupling factor transporter ATP-binding protein EcfA2